jgi:membrane fusion protein, multidrug efflux system
METTDDANVGGEITTIASKIAGFVETVAIADNQTIKAGDLLVKLDDRVHDLRA